MAYTLLLNTVPNAEVQDALRGKSRIVQTGIVGGMTSDITSSQLALMNALYSVPGMPVKGSEFHPTYPDYKLVYRSARGIENTGGTKAYVYLHYETPTTGGSPIESFAVEDGGTLVSEQTSLVPGSLNPMYCSLTNTVVDLSVDPQPANVRLVSMPYSRNYSSLVLHGLFANRPSAAVKAAGNCVNDAPWQGRPRGYWRCEPPRCTYSNRDGLYRVTVGFLSKGTEPGDDWSSYTFARDDTGELVRPPKSWLDTLRNQTYEYQMRSNRYGVFKCGMHPLKNFFSIFGV